MLILIGPVILLLFIMTLFHNFININAQFDFYANDDNGLQVGTKPISLALNSNLTKLYVAYEFSDKVSVIDLEKGSQIQTISVERFPHLLSSDPSINRVYVTNGGSGSISIIDADTNSQMDSIKLPYKVSDIAIDPITHKAFVVNGLKGLGFNVSAIDIYTNSIIGKNVTLGPFDARIDFNPYTNKLYATSNEDATTAVIDGNSNLRVTDINTGNSSSIDIAYNPYTNSLYILDNQPSIKIIDGMTDTVRDIISLEEEAYAIDINLSLNMLYLLNSDAVIPVNAVTNEVYDPIMVGHNPKGLAIDESKNLIYVANSDSNSISIINGTTNTLLAGFTFNINPTDAGNIYCANAPKSVNDLPEDKLWEKISKNYVLYPLNSIVYCKAKVDTQLELEKQFGALGDMFWNIHMALVEGTKFKSWSGDVISPIANISKENIEFKVNKFGIKLNANFDENASPTLLPPEYRNIIVGLAIPAIAGWIYKKRDSFFKKKHTEYFNRYEKILNILEHYYKTEKDNDKYKSDLNNIRNQITDLFGESKLNELEYSRLIDRIIVSERKLNEKVD